MADRRSPGRPTSRVARGRLTKSHLLNDFSESLRLNSGMIWGFRLGIGKSGP